MRTTRFENDGKATTNVDEIEQASDVLKSLKRILRLHSTHDKTRREMLDDLERHGEAVFDKTQAGFISL